jgi:magnesium and cobalt transporter
MFFRPAHLGLGDRLSCQNEQLKNFATLHGPAKAANAAPMNDDIANAPSPAPRTWLERLGLALLGGEAQSREDLIDELRQARRNGVLDADTLRMLEGAIGVVEKVASDVLVPRGQMVSLNTDMSFEEVIKIAVESGHSRFPIFGEDEERIIGILLAKDLLKQVSKPDEFDLKVLMRNARMVPETKRLNELLKEFRANRAHMAVVVNEYGGIAGLVTIEDVLEEIVGPIDDEHDAEDKPVQYVDAFADGSFVVQALMPIEEFNAQFSARLTDQESDTIGGLVVHELGRLAEVGDEVRMAEWHFEVADADGRRLHALRVRKISE